MSFVSSLPPLRNLVKATLWCGAIWAVGYGSYKVTVAQMEKNVKTVRVPTWAILFRPLQPF